ncbi:hypothetical protein DYBT9623_01905 [Dyadobacter sp. CECT 9623]|uniref:Uncharacterized protein n=1 Tax=Dyadobacter linearis TaxID=2823330 RepID=A0ABN7R7B5_9BACT|nr:hypothetical protein DYBT9623_01905 [Dyadobacter sp. CECT 9623]
MLLKAGQNFNLLVSTYSIILKNKRKLLPQNPLITRSCGRFRVLFDYLHFTLHHGIMPGEGANVLVGARLFRRDKKDGF